MNINSIQSDFPQLKTQVHGRDLCYLDNAATTLKPQSVVDSLNSFYSYQTANIHRGVHFLSENGTILFEAVRDQIQNFIKAKHRHEVIITKGTTDSINLVATSFSRSQLVGAGDVILLSTMEHHSNIVPWQMLAEQKKMTVIEIPINDHGEIDWTKYLDLLNQYGKKIKIISVAHVSNALGSINPIKKMIEEARKIEAYFFVDAAQSIAHIPVDVVDLDCDFLAFSSHKAYGPFGVGVLYGKEKWLNELPPYQGGGDMIDEVRIEKTTYNKLPHKFEAGTPVIAEVIAFGQALNYIQQFSWEEIHRHEQQLMVHATARLSKIPGLKIVGTAKEKISIASFVIQGVHHQDLGTLLDQMGIAVRTGHHCTQPLMRRFNITGTTRASFALYTELKDIDKLAEGIEKALKLL